MITQETQVSVYRADDVLPSELPGATFIKIDVEGFEPFVIQGLSATLDRLLPIQ